MALPPGLPLPASIQTILFLLRPEGLQTWATRRFGDLFTVANSVFGVFVATSDPTLIKQVFTGDPKNLHAGEGNSPLRPIVGGRSVLLLDGDEHLGRRRLVAPAFHGERMHAYAEAMRRVTEEVIGGWRPGQQLTLYPSMQRITLDVILEAVFGLGPGPRQAALRDGLRALLGYIQSPLGMLVMVPAFQRDLGRLTPWAGFKRELDRVDEMVFSYIADRRKDTGARGVDVLSQLLDVGRDEGGGLTDSEIRDDLMTLVIAGHESTATELCWAFSEILTHPEVEARLVAEIDEKAAALPGKVGELEYLDAVVKETLRLHPVIGSVARVLKENMVLRGYELPKEMIVAPSILLTHRRPELYPDPDTFRPERFLGKKTDPYTYLPFGGGVRRCLGAAFAIYEMKVVLATVFGRVRLRSVLRKAPRAILRSLAFSPKDGTRVIIEGPRAKTARPPAAPSS